MKTESATPRRRVTLRGTSGHGFSTVPAFEHTVRAIYGSALGITRSITTRSTCPSIASSLWTWVVTTGLASLDREVDMAGNAAYANGTGSDGRHISARGAIGWR